MKERIDFKSSWLSFKETFGCCIIPYKLHILDSYFACWYGPSFALLYGLRLPALQALEESQILKLSASIRYMYSGNLMHP
jgi:hypothetical protein